MSWLHRVLGKNGITQLGVDSTHSAARVAQRPMELGTRGAFSLGAASGVMAAGLVANSEIFQFRWTAALVKCAIRSVTISAGSIAAFTAGVGRWDLMFARNWTVDGTGGSAITFTGNDQKKRTDFGGTNLTSGSAVRIASTAALTAGTKTLDTNPLSCNSFGCPAVAGQTLGGNPKILWQRNTPDEYPLFFEQNDGFIIRATVAATGTWSFCVTVEWAELDVTEVDGWS